MASSLFCYMPNPSMNSTTTFTADPIIIPRQLSSRHDDHLSLLKSNEYPLTVLKSHKQSITKDAIITDHIPITKSKLANVWREIHGLNNWENLIDPLDPLLRHEIIRYGEFVTACYKAFDLDPNSKRYLNCKYGKKNMLRGVGMSDSGYKVTKYIYATAPNIDIPIPTTTTTSNSCCGRWIGYVAVSEDKDVITRLGRRDIVVNFRGTVTNLEWAANFMSSLTLARLDPHDSRPDVKVEAGFLSLYTSNESGEKFGLCSCREQLLSEVSRLLKKYEGEEISITISGHSMGSSLALLLAYDISELGLNKIDNKGQKIPVSVFSFGGPRVGNLGFKERCEELGVRVLRVVNVNDPITKLPGFFFNENLRVFKGCSYEFSPWSCSCYAHVGVELLVDFFKMHNPSCVHDLESYIGLLKSFHKSKLDYKVQKGELGVISLMERAKGFLLGSAQDIDMLQWGNIAFSMVNLVQISQWI